MDQLSGEHKGPTIPERRWGKDWLTDPDHDPRTCATCIRIQPEMQAKTDVLQKAIAEHSMDGEQLLAKVQEIAALTDVAHTKEN